MSSPVSYNGLHCVCPVSSLKEGEDQKEINIEPAQALDEVEPLPEDCYTRPINLPEGKRQQPLTPKPNH